MKHKINIICLFYYKGEEGSDMKLDFTFDSELAQLTEQKITTTSSISHTMQVSNGTPGVGVQSPISPSTDELNLKIASVKKVWENVPPMPTVLEHPPQSGNGTNEEVSHSDNSFVSFSGNNDHSTNPLMNGTVDNSQNRKDCPNIDSSEVSFRTSPSIQQTGNNTLPVSLVPKGVMNMEPNICKVKPQVQSHQNNQIPGCTGPVSPPPIGLDTNIGIRTLAGLASSVQVAGIPAVPSPPTVLFNSSQQMAQTGLYQHLQMDSSQVLTQQSRAVAAAAAAAMAQFSQTPHGYAAPLGTYGLSHQPASAQLSNAFGQQSMFMQTPPAAHQAQDLYSSSQYRVQPPYAQGQHVTSMSSNQVLNVNAQQNLSTSHLLGSQLVQTRPTPGPAPSPAGPPTPHIQSLHGIQTVQPAPATSYYSTSAQGQSATNFYPQPTPLTAPGSPMQQQQPPQFPSQQGFSSQSALNVLTPAAPATQNFRSFGGHQFKATGAVMNNITGVTDTLRSSSHSPTMDSSICSRGGMFAVGNTTTTTVNSGSVMTVPQISSSGMSNKMGQQQQVAACTSPGNVRLTNSQRLTVQSPTVTGGKGTQHGLTQSPQQYYPFNQPKYNHVQATNPNIRPVIYQGVVRNNPHQAQYGGTTNTIHYPSPIQRPGHNSSQQQTAQQSQRNVGRSQNSGIKVTAQLTSAQQAKLRAEAVQQTHMFFSQTSGGKAKIENSGLEKRTSTSNASIEDTKGLKANEIPTNPTLSQGEADTKKAIENKDKLEE
ncbi:uncharacterized protein LOC111642572 [Centruroides sculpturatus]|uniref:uncharacterized protein LOC111642572 n=1 Tax=Centruroides sculpturatus TaxID=218467 RepID=UPI000C6EED9B|nr:uncharacterized protein LOC111642572 [Centruroides sculpturatus]